MIERDLRYCNGIATKTNFAVVKRHAIALDRHRKVDPREHGRRARPAGPHHGRVRREKIDIIDRKVCDPHFDRGGRRYRTAGVGHAREDERPHVDLDHAFRGHGQRIGAQRADVVLHADLRT